MEQLKKQIGDEIMKNRPKLSPSSLKTYISILSNIYKSMKGDEGVDWFSENVKKIIEHLENKPDQTKKTSLSALFVLTKDDGYREVMMTILKAVNTENNKQQKTAKQEENWIGEDEVGKVYQEQLSNAILMLSRKQMFNETKFVQFLLVAFLSGAGGIPPRRSQDYGEMKIRNFDPKTDNYYRAGKFYFNVYKTSSTYGLQTLDVPKTLNTIIKKWIKLNTTDYMLYSTNKQKLSSPQISRILNNAFGKNISTNLLRHIFLSDKYKNIPALESINNLATAMGHSSATALQYIKH